jgi:phosphoglucosamine mutase
MPRLFGTDGVRGVANKDLTPDLVLALGRAAGLVLAPDGGDVVVGRDTRLSGPMLESALTAGLASAGATVRVAGILPTPAVSWLTVELGAAAGAVISASHNPVRDNGVKFFSGEGVKTSAETEDAIESRLTEHAGDLPVGSGIGGIETLATPATGYVQHLLGSLTRRLDGVKVVLDCAFGAAWEVGPAVFREAGAEVVAVNAQPDGARINVDCGSTSLDQVARRVVEEGASVGFAFDGDADRVLAVDERGNEVDGDRILGIAALHLKDSGELTKQIVVATVMSNLGLRRALEEHGIEVVAAPVGDKFVAEAMLEHGAALGGEQSGHVIFGAHTPTGDGVLTALKVAEIVISAGRPLSEVAGFFEPYPQVLVNVQVASKDGLQEAEALWEEVTAVEESLGDEGRVLVRASGTEPLVRVMVEAPESATARAVAEELAKSVRTHLG